MEKTVGKQLMGATECAQGTCSGHAQGMQGVLLLIPVQLCFPRFRPKAGPKTVVCQFLVKKTTKKLRKNHEKSGMRLVVLWHEPTKIPSPKLKSTGNFHGCVGGTVEHDTVRH